MAVTLIDILHIEKMRDAVIVAGEAHLNKKVSRIATIEKPFVDHPEYCYQVVKPDDIYLSKLFVFHEQKDKLYAELSFMKETNGSGLITHKEELAFLDEEIINRAEELRIPIIAIDNDFGFTELTYNILDLIIKDEVIQVQRANLERLLSHNVAEEELKHHVEGLTVGLGSYSAAIYIQSAERIPFNAFRMEPCDLLLPLYGGLMYLFSADTEESTLEKKRNFLHKIKTMTVHYHGGESRIYKGSGHFKQEILEAIYASSYSSFWGIHHCDYTKLKEYALLTELRHNPALKVYREEIYAPLMEFDQRHKLDLIRLMELFVRYRGSYEEISKHLFIHETTVRYRMNKLLEILGYNAAHEFYADAKLAVYADYILRSSLLNKLE